MKVVIFAQRYEPEPRAAARRVSATARKLAGSGFTVEVVTGFADDAAFDRHRGKVLAFERDGGIHVTRLWRYAAGKSGGIRRALGWFSTAFGACAAGLLKMHSLDAVYVSVPSMALALPALAASYFGHARIFLDVTDANPEVEVGSNAGPFDRWFANLVASVTNSVYRRARTVFCASEEIRDAVAARCGPETEILVARDGFDRVAPASIRPFVRTDREFVATYAGNMGAESGLDLVLDAASQLRDDPQIRFVLIGDGTQAPRLRERITAEGLSNVAFLGVLDQPASLEAFAESDLAVVLLRDDAVKAVPSKMFDALSVGCPLLLSANGDARRFVEATGGGWCVPPEDAGVLASALRAAAADRETCRNRGKTGREYALANYDRDRIALGVVRNVFAATSPAMNRRDAQLVHVNYGGTSDS